MTMKDCALVILGAVAVGLIVDESVAEGVLVGVPVGVSVDTGESVGVPVGVSLGRDVLVGTAVSVGVAVDVLVGKAVLAIDVSSDAMPTAMTRVATAAIRRGPRRPSFGRKPLRLLSRWALFYPAGHSGYRRPQGPRVLRQFLQSPTNVTQIRWERYRRSDMLNG